MSTPCYVRYKKSWIEGECLGVFQHSHPIDASLMVGGHPGGVIAYPVAVVKVGGRLNEYKTSDVIFKDGDSE